MKKLYRTVFAMFLLIASPCVMIQAEESATLPVEGVQPVIAIRDGVIATTVENRLPQGVGNQFPATVGMLYCFTTVGGAEVDTSISHTWYYQDKEMAEVVLPVRSMLWRTWSSKTILPEWKGNWKIVVTAEDGTLLETIFFSVE